MNETVNHETGSPPPKNGKIDLDAVASWVLVIMAIALIVLILSLDLAV